MTVQALAKLIERQQRKCCKRDNPEASEDELQRMVAVQVRPGNKHIRLWIGANPALVVDNAGVIWGARTDGAIDYRYQYGTLDTVNEWTWGEYKPFRKEET